MTIDENDEFAMLFELEQSVGRNVIVSMLNDFQTNKTETIEKLDKASERTDIVEIKSIAHQMYGTCGSFGFLRIAKLFRQMDEAAQNENTDEIKRLVTFIHNHNEALDTALWTYYPEIAP
jgi:HPt (histidine-containing phosphotransfer) domain-containing protein